MSDLLVDVKKLTVDFGSGAKTVRAVAGVDLTLGKGETVALLGESGSGKSVTLRALMRLHPKSARIGGAIEVDGRDVPLTVGYHKVSVDIRDQIVLTRNLEWKLCQFFTAISQRKHGETLHPRWNAVIGSKGHCEVVIEDYTKKDGTPGKSAKIGKYLNPEEYAKTVAAATEEDI